MLKFVLAQQLSTDAQKFRDGPLTRLPRWSFTSGRMLLRTKRVCMMLPSERMISGSVPIEEGSKMLNREENYRGVYWTKLLTMLKFDEICRNLQESEGIGRNWRESAGIRGNQREFAGISRNQQEQAGMYRFHYFVILQSIRNERECKYRNIFDFILPNLAVLARS